jgi:hypothetical protein
LSDRGYDLADTEIIHILTLGIAPYAEARFASRFRHNALFIGANVRSAILEARADYTPVFLSEIPKLFRTGRVPLDVAPIEVSPPDEHGFCSYGVSVDVVKAAAESARSVVAEVNPRMPRTLGDSFIHVSRIERLVEQETPLLESIPAQKLVNVDYENNMTVVGVVNEGGRERMVAAGQYVRDPATNLADVAFLVEVMGRGCGYIALMSAIAGGAEAVVIPEVEADPEAVAADLRAAYERGQAHAIVVVAEGARLNAEGLSRYFEEHRKRLGFELRATILGHVQRGGAPGVFDRLLATRFGDAAVRQLACGTHGVLVGLLEGDIATTPLAEVVSAEKRLDLGLLDLAQTLAR